jgi:hypothetical protein
LVSSEYKKRCRKQSYQTIKETTTCSRGKGGVGIILSDRGKQAWIEAGGNEPDLGDEFDCARFIGITLKFSNKQEKNETIYITSEYHPHDQLNPLFHDKLGRMNPKSKGIQ